MNTAQKMSDLKAALAAREMELRRQTVAAMKLRLIAERDRRIITKHLSLPRQNMSPATSPSTRTILLVSADTELRSVARSFLEHVGFNVVICADASRVEHTFAACRADLVIIDNSGPVDPALPLARTISRIGQDLHIIVLRGPGTSEEASDCRKRGWAVLPKPCVLPSLLEMIQRAFDSEQEFNSAAH
jgi:CheY-like chemotaxis protein